MAHLHKSPCNDHSNYIKYLELNLKYIIIYCPLLVRLDIKNCAIYFY